MAAMPYDPLVSLFLFAIVAACCAATATAESRLDGAFLVFSRTISGDFVEGVNVTITYQIHNIGKV
jgi:hypothetical protein